MYHIESLPTGSDFRQIVKKVETVEPHQVDEGNDAFVHCTNSLNHSHLFVGSSLQIPLAG